MADATNASDAAGATTGGEGAGKQTQQSTGTPPADNSNGATAPQPIDLSKLTSSDVDKLFAERGDLLFQHPRFKELNEKAKEADKLKKAQDDAEKKTLEEQGKWQEIAKKSEEKANTLTQQLQQQAQNSSLLIEAQKAGVSDLDAALKLVDRASVSVDENGTVTGSAEAIKALVEAKPYLVGGKPQVKIGSASNPANSQTGDNAAQTTADGKRIYKLTEIQDVKFYRENAADIKLAMKEGRMQNDTGSAVGIAGGQQ